jgi:hypothetical protein
VLKDKVMPRLVRFAPVVLALAVIGWLVNQELGHRADQDGIRRVMAQVFDKPSFPVEVNPVVIDGEHALADWIQGGFGGRTVLRKMQGQWVVVLCGGHGLTQSATLVETGMPVSSATVLSKALAEAEARLGPETLKKFTTFDGVAAVYESIDAHHTKPAGAKP